MKKLLALSVALGFVGSVALGSVEPDYAYYKSPKPFFISNDDLTPVVTLTPSTGGQAITLTADQPVSGGVTYFPTYGSMQYGFAVPANPEFGGGWENLDATEKQVVQQYDNVIKKASRLQADGCYTYCPPPQNYTP